MKSVNPHGGILADPGIKWPQVALQFHHQFNQLLLTGSVGRTVTTSTTTLCHNNWLVRSFGKLIFNTSRSVVMT